MCAGIFTRYPVHNLNRTRVQGVNIANEPLLRLLTNVASQIIRKFTAIKRFANL